MSGPEAYDAPPSPSFAERRRARRQEAKARRARARERRQTLSLLDAADEPRRSKRLLDRISRTPPVLILIIGLAGDLIGTTALGVAFALQHQQTQHNSAARAHDHEILCDFYADAGRIRLVTPNGVPLPPAAGAFASVFSDAAKTHALLGCGPLPPPRSIIVNVPTASPTTGGN